MILGIKKATGEGVVCANILLCVERSGPLRRDQLQLARVRLVHDGKSSGGRLPCSRRMPYEVSWTREGRAIRGCLQGHACDSRSA